MSASRPAAAATRIAARFKIVAALAATVAALGLTLAVLAGILGMHTNAVAAVAQVHATGVTAPHAAGVTAPHATGITAPHASGITQNDTPCESPAEEHAGSQCVQTPGGQAGLALQAPQELFSAHLSAPRDPVRTHADPPLQRALSLEQLSIRRT